MFRNILFVFVGGPLFLPLALAYLAAAVVAALAVLRSVVTTKEKDALAGRQESAGRRCLLSKESNHDHQR